jgi:hypothetical protein
MVKTRRPGGYIDGQTILTKHETSIRFARVAVGPDPGQLRLESPQHARDIPSRVPQRLVYTPETLLSLRMLLSREHP